MFSKFIYYFTVLYTCHAIFIFEVILISNSDFENDFDFENEIDDEYLKAYYENVMYELGNRCDDDYELNWVQWRKLVAVVALFDEISSDYDTVYPVEIKPSHEVGNVIADFVTLGVNGNDVAKFCKALSFASAISFDIVDDMIHIEVVIPKVFKEKK